MPIIVSRHLLKAGKTLASSSDLTALERAELEAVKFGYTADREYIESLWPDPAYICRRLKSGRWAITRILPDEKEENLLFISAIVSHNDWFENLSCDCDSIIYSSNIWRFHGSAEPIAIEQQQAAFGPDENTVKLSISLLEAVETFYNSGKTVIVSEQDFSSRAFRWLNMLLPVAIRQNFSYAVGALTDGTGLHITSISDKASHSGIKGQTVLWYQGRPSVNCLYSKQIANIWHSGELVPLDFVDGFIDFVNKKTVALSKISSTLPVKQTTNQYQSRLDLTAIPITQTTQHKKSPARFFKWFLAIILICIFAASGIYLAFSFKTDIEIKKISSQSAEFLQDNSLAIIFQANPDFEPIMQKYEQLISQINQSLAKADNDNLVKLKNKLQSWHQNAKLALVQKTALESLFLQAEGLEIVEPMVNYSRPEIIAKADSLLQQLTEHQNNFKLPNSQYIQKTQQLISNLKRFISSLDIIIDDIKGQIDKLTLDIQNIKTDYYSLSAESGIESAFIKIKELENGQSLLNAAQSPRKENLEKSVELLSRLTDTKKQAQDKKNLLTSKKESANSNLTKIKNILNSLQNLELDKQYVEIENASELVAAISQDWPDNLEIEELISKILKIKADINDKLSAIKPILPEPNIPVVIVKTDTNSVVDVNQNSQH